MTLRDIYTDCVDLGTVRAKGFRFLCCAAFVQMGIARDRDRAVMQTVEADVRHAAGALSGDVFQRIEGVGHQPSRDLKEAAAKTVAALAEIGDLFARIRTGAGGPGDLRTGFEIQSERVFPGFSRFLDVFARELDASEASQQASNAAMVSAAVAEIDGISSVIDLIAVNASIEAAHAGDAGRGFAVIATDIRQLSQRSRVALDDIRGRLT